MRYALLAVAALLVLSAPAAAQVRTQSGSGTTGSSLFGSGGSLFGSGATGAGGSGAGLGGGTGVGGAGGNAQFGAAANNPFVLNEPGGSGGFVGRDSTDTGAIFESLNATNNAFLDQIERRFVERNRGRDANESVDARSKIRVTLKLAFTPPRPASGMPAATTARLNSLFAERGFRGAKIESTADGFVLRGSVPDESDRRMLSRLVSMEPGVPRVVNELTIAP